MPNILSPEPTFDSMTGLKDRMAFFHDIDRYRTAGTRAHVVMVQIPQLMWINRKYGVPAGDQLLRDIAHWLEGLDAACCAYRIANSRFMLLGPACDLDAAAQTANRLCARFEENWTVHSDGQTHIIRAKALVVHLFLDPEDGDTDLLDKLNYGLSVLSGQGTDRVLFFGDEIRQAMERQQHILEEVRYAIEHKTFQMYYQPIYNCREKKFTSAESLIRLFGREGEFISPGDFIPMAEENGLIDQISWIVLEKVCRFLGDHPELPLGSVSVNLTGQQVLDPTFLQRIEALLEDCRLDGSRLRIEITERTVTEDLPGVKTIMERLSQRGIRFYLDDFGTGYSNLSSMLSLFFEVVKFDKSLIDIMDSTPQKKRTIGLLAEIMHENHSAIVAEGIETQSQAETAREIALDRIQGYYYAKPLSEEALLRFLEEHS